MENKAKKEATLAERLREALNSKRLRAADLCEMAGVPKSAVSYYLAGKSEPKADRLYKIAQALQVSEAWLMGYAVPMQRTGGQKKNDRLARLVVRMRSDKNFYGLVDMLDGLSPEQLDSVRRLVAAFQQDF